MSPSAAGPQIAVTARYTEFRAAIGNVPGFYRLDQCDEDGAPIEHVPPATEAPRRARLAARARFLELLVLDRDALLAADRDVGATLIALVDRLVRAERTIDRHVWLDAVAALVAPCEYDQRVALAQRAARRVHAVFQLAARDRFDRALLRRLWPLD